MNPRMLIVFLFIGFTVIASAIATLFPKTRAMLIKIPPVSWLTGEMLDWRRNLKELFFAVLIVIGINITLVQNYLIPSGSMIPTLVEGDRLFANRVLYGIKLPFTDGINGLRLPVIRYPKHGDIVIFRAPPSSYYACEGKAPLYPPSPLIQFLRGPIMLFCLSPISWDPRIILFEKIGDIITDGKQFAPAITFFGLKTVDIDPAKEYVKRVIGVGGDIIEIKNKKLFVNGNEIEDKWGYFGDPNTYPKHIDYGRDNYGPIYIPKVGDKLTFKKYANFTSASDKGGYDIFVEGREESVSPIIKTWYWVNIYEMFSNEEDEFVYEVEEPFYFVMGDNRDYSCDSRRWGLLHFPYIKGQPNIAYFQAPRPPAGKKGYLKYFIIR